MNNIGAYWYVFEGKQFNKCILIMILQGYDWVKSNMATKMAAELANAAQ